MIQTYLRCLEPAECEAVLQDARLCRSYLWLCEAERADPALLAMPRLVDLGGMSNELSLLLEGGEPAGAPLDFFMDGGRSADPDDGCAVLLPEEVKQVAGALETLTEVELRARYLRMEELLGPSTDTDEEAEEYYQELNELFYRVRDLYVAAAEAGDGILQVDDY